MRIREATAADAAAIRALVTDTLAEFGFSLDPAGNDADLADGPGGYQQRGGAFRVVVDDNDSVMGCGALDRLAPGVARLRKMYFRPSIRGQGIGRLLLEDLIAEARRRNFSRIELETASHLVAAIGLYQSAGFVETHGPKHSSRCDRSFSLELR